MHESIFETSTVGSFISNFSMQIFFKHFPICFLFFLSSFLWVYLVKLWWSLSCPVMSQMTDSPSSLIPPPSSLLSPPSSLLPPPSSLLPFSLIASGTQSQSSQPPVVLLLFLFYTKHFSFVPWFPNPYHARLASLLEKKKKKLFSTKTTRAIIDADRTDKSENPPNKGV